MLRKLFYKFIGHPGGEPCSLCGIRTDRPGQKHMEGVWHWWDGGPERFSNTIDPPHLPVPQSKLMSVLVKFPSGIQCCHRCMKKKVNEVFNKGSGKYIGNLNDTN